MKNAFIAIRTIVFICFAVYYVFLTGCEESAHLERYEDPPWLGGSNIETLIEWTEKSNGNKDSSYAVFLRLMELAEYKEPMEKGLFTIFLPSDKAFEDYFQKAGIDSVGVLNKEQAQTLFTLHFLRNPLSRYYLVYDYEFGEVQDDEGEYGPLFFRNQTRSEASPYLDSVRYFGEFKGEKLRIYGFPKLLPLFSTELMQAINGDPDGSDYEFICRSTNWSKSGLNWHDAEITEAEIPTASGFIYKIDRVIAPPPSIDRYLMDNQDQFGVFYDLMQRFAEYVNPDFDESMRLMYRKTYNTVFDIANEYGPFTRDPFRRKDIFTALVPTNNVLQQYLDENIFTFYESVDSVPDVTLSYLLQSHLAESMLLASKMRRTFFNSFGDQIDIDPDTDIKDAHLCSNGVVYTLDKILEPNAFALAPGPLFFDGNYSTFLRILLESGLLPSLSQTDVPVTIFAPDNNSMDEYGIRYDKNADLLERVQVRKSDGRWYAMETEDLDLFVTDHIIFEKISDFGGFGYQEMSSGNYIKFDSELLRAGGNIEDEDACNIIRTEDNEVNGILYLMDNALKTPKKTIASVIMEDPEYSDFKALLDSMKLISFDVDVETNDTTPKLVFVSGEANGWTAFIPTNEALAANPVPEGVDTTNFIRYHFLRGENIFDDGKVSGTFPTAYALPQEEDEEIIRYAELVITNNENSLMVTDNSGQQVIVPHNAANTIVQKAVVHKINAVLKSE